MKRADNKEAECVVQAVKGCFVHLYSQLQLGCHPSLESRTAERVNAQNLSTNFKHNQVDTAAQRPKSHA